MVHHLTPHNDRICPDDPKLKALGADEVYPQGSPHLNPVMKADQYPTLANIGGDTHMDVALAGDAVDGKFTAEPGEFAALGDARSQRRRLQLEGSVLFHADALGVDRT